MNIFFPSLFLSFPCGDQLISLQILLTAPWSYFAVSNVALCWVVRTEDLKFWLNYLHSLELWRRFCVKGSISITKRESSQLFNKLSCEISVTLPALAATPYQPVPWLGRLVAVPLTAGDRVRFQAIHCGICSGRSVIGSCFSPNISFFSWYHSTNATYSSPTLLNLSSW